MQEHNFTEGRIFGPLVRFALPVLAALFLQTMYGAVDLLVVGQFSSAGDISAVSTGSMLMQTITFVITGTAMGLTVVVARKIGEGRQRDAGEAIGTGIWFFAVLGIAFSAVCVLATPLLSRLMQAPPEAIKATDDYIRICSAGLIFITAYNLIGSIFRGLGDSILPLITVAIACGINIGADLLLIAVFDMGAAGAAIATVFSQAVSVALSFVIMKRRQLPFELHRKDVRPVGTYIRSIVSLGAPIALQDLLVSISFLVIMAIVNTLGVIASSGVGVAEKLCGFLMLVPSAYNQAMSAFVAQNMGARKPTRARLALRYSIISSLAVGMGLAVLTFFDGDGLAAIFARDPQIISAAADYLKAYAIDCVLTSFLFCYIGFFNGCGETRFVMMQGIVGAIGVRVPASWIFSRILPVSLFRIGLATPLSSALQIVLCALYYRKVRDREPKECADVS